MKGKFYSFVINTRKLISLLTHIYVSLARIKKTPVFRKLMSLKKSAKEQSNRHIANMADNSDSRSCLEKFIGEVSKKSATKQVLIGATSGW